MSVHDIRNDRHIGTELSSVPIWRIVNYFWEYRRIRHILKHWKKCIISHLFFLTLDDICKIEFWTLYSFDLASVRVTPRNSGWLLALPFSRGKNLKIKKIVITIRKGRLLLVNNQGFSKIALCFITLNLLLFPLKQFAGLYLF